MESFLLPSDFKGFMSSSKYSELDSVIRMKKDTTTKTNNIIPPGEGNTASNKAIISPTIIISTRDIKNIINNNKFGDKMFIEKDIFTKIAPFTEYISKEAHDILFVGKTSPNNEDIVTIMPVDSVLEYVADNYDFELVKKGNEWSAYRKDHINDSNVFECHAPYASAAISEHLSQGTPIDIKTTKKHQTSSPKWKTLILTMMQLFAKVLLSILILKLLDDLFFN